MFAQGVVDKTSRGTVVSYYTSQRVPCLLRWPEFMVGLAYSDYSPEPLQDIALGSAVEKLLELARGQLSCGCSADIAGIAGGFEGKVAGCRKRPVSKAGWMHSERARRLHVQDPSSINRKGTKDAMDM